MLVWEGLKKILIILLVVKMDMQVIFVSSVSTGSNDKELMVVVNVLSEEQTLFKLLD